MLKTADTTGQGDVTSLNLAGRLLIKITQAAAKNPFFRSIYFEELVDFLVGSGYE